MVFYIKKNSICFTENSNEVLVTAGVSWMFHNFIFFLYAEVNYIPWNMYMDYFALSKH